MGLKDRSMDKSWGEIKQTMQTEFGDLVGHRSRQLCMRPELSICRIFPAHFHTAFDQWVIYVSIWFCRAQGEDKRNYKQMPRMTSCTSFTNDSLETLISEDPKGIGSVSQLFSKCFLEIWAPKGLVETKRHLFAMQFRDLAQSLLQGRFWQEESRTEARILLTSFESSTRVIRVSREL